MRSINQIKIANKSSTLLRFFTEKPHRVNEPSDSQQVNHLVDVVGIPQ